MSCSGALLPHSLIEPLEKRKAIAPNSVAGFLLIDTSLNPISFNEEAIQILSYPDNLANLRRPGVFLSLIHI